MIKRIQDYFLHHNLGALGDKIFAGTATEQDKENFDRMLSYEEYGRW